MIIFKNGINVVFSTDSGSVNTPYVCYYLTGVNVGGLFQFRYHGNAIDIYREPSFYTDQFGVPFTSVTLQEFIDDLETVSSGGGGVWGDITGTLSSQTDLQTALNAKQDDLISGTNIKTINGASVLGSGDLVVSGSGLSDGDYGDITVSSSGTVWDIDAATVGTTELSATGTPSATTFLRGDNTWSAPTAPDPAGWTTIVKSANQDVTNSTTLADDNDLQFSVVAGGHYMIEMNLCWSTNSASGLYRWRFQVDAGAMTGAGVANSYLTTNSIFNANGAATTLILPQTPIASFDFLNTSTIHFNFYANTNATFTFVFANAAAGAGRISRTWKGSILKYKRID